MTLIGISAQGQCAEGFVGIGAENRRNRRVRAGRGFSHSSKQRATRLINRVQRMDTGFPRHDENQGIQKWTLKDAAHNLPAKDRRNISPAMCVSIPSSRHPIRRARVAPVSRSSRALGRHGTPTAWADPDRHVRMWVGAKQRRPKMHRATWSRVRRMRCIGRAPRRPWREFKGQATFLKGPARPSYSPSAPSSLERFRSKVPNGRWPAFRAVSRIKQSENPNAGRLRYCSSATATPSDS